MRFDADTKCEIQSFLKGILMYKLIALDIDDTLLGDDLTLSQANKKRLQQLAEKVQL